MIREKLVKKQFFKFTFNKVLSIIHSLTYNIIK